MLSFETGTRYRRADVKELAGLPPDAKGGNWDTGIVEHEDEFVIFANVGTEGRTGHDYNNRWEDERFRWSHKGGSKLQWPSVAKLVEERRRVHLFWRESNSAPFEYAGLATVVEVVDKTPVEICGRSPIAPTVKISSRGQTKSTRRGTTKAPRIRCR